MKHNTQMISSLTSTIYELKALKNDIAIKNKTLKTKLETDDKRTFDGLSQLTDTFEIQINLIIEKSELELAVISKFNDSFHRVSSENEQNNDEKRASDMRMDFVSMDATEMNKTNHFEMDHYVSVNNEYDCRRFLFDPEYQDEVETIKKTIVMYPKTKSDLISINLNINEKSLESLPSMRFNSTGELSKLPAEIQKYLNQNTAFQQYPVTDSGDKRESLPCSRDPSNKIEIWRILKENIGSSFSLFTIPIYLREPLTFNQKCVEIFEFSDLLRKANNTDSLGHKLGCIASFYILSIGQNEKRIKASFDSFLGETFEFVKDDLQIITEAICDTPLTTAFYAECKDFIVEGTFSIDCKISIPSLDFQPIGDLRVTLKKRNETFSIKRPLISVMNYSFGDPFIWAKEKLIVTKLDSKIAAVIEFKEKGWSSKTDKEFVGQITNERGERLARLAGKWDDKMFLIDEETSLHYELASLTKNQKLSQMNYHFNNFSINLNVCSYETLRYVPITDSRLRPDLRAYEYGNIELASFENYRLNQNQKTRNSKLQEPKWFKISRVGDQLIAKYLNNYFEKRVNREWPTDLPQLFI